MRGTPVVDRPAPVLAPALALDLAPARDLAPDLAPRRPAGC